MYLVIFYVARNPHCCRMLLMRHYNQRLFDETVCDAIIANGGVKEPSKMSKTFVMTDASNTVQILVACAMRGIWLICMNYLRWDRTTEMGSHTKVCAIYDTQFTQMNCLLLGNATETVSQIKVCVIYDIRFTQINCFQLGKRTETVHLNKMCVICGICDQPKEHKLFMSTRCVWYAANSPLRWTVCDEKL